MSFYNRILNRVFQTNDKFYSGDPDPLPQADGPVRGVEVSEKSDGSKTYKIQWGANSGSDQHVEPNKTKQVKEYK